MSIVCAQCRRTLGEHTFLAAISGSILGDEHTDAYYLCPHCDVFTVASWRDHFTGVETRSLSGPLARHQGEASVELIRKCSRPWDKKCRCEAHREYFRGTLD